MSSVGSLAILGSTGSIGTQTLDVVRANGDAFTVCALAAGRNIELLIRQVEEFSPQLVSVQDESDVDVVKQRIGRRCKVVCGKSGLCEVATYPDAHTIVNAVVGFSGLEPLLASISSGKHVALANKESLVAGGSLIKSALANSSSVIVPVDSEHNSIFQCLMARGREGLRRIGITASGGPFFRFSKEQLAEVTPEQAVKHPRWNMGQKISVDSATLMNKGLEVIEAAMLFEVSADKMSVLIHPQSIMHGFVEYDDGSVIAALFETDMRVPIAFALSYLRSEDPKLHLNHVTYKSNVSFLDLAKKEKLEFFSPDFEKFPALSLCYEALRIGKSMPLIVNAANEEAVCAFLNHRVPFNQITNIVESVMLRHTVTVVNDLKQIFELNSWARNVAIEFIGK